jgi:hypothetical protein
MEGETKRIEVVIEEMRREPEGMRGKTEKVK